MTSATNSQQQNALATHARTIAQQPNTPLTTTIPASVQQQAQQQGCQWYDVGCLLNAAFAPVGQLTAFLNPLWQWVQNPVRVVKMVGGILLVGVALLLLIKPESIDSVPTVKGTKSVFKGKGIPKKPVPKKSTPKKGQAKK